MTTSTGLGAHSTAADVLVGIDLAGRTAVVTGGYSGVGLATTLALSRAGARVIVPARRPEVAREVLAGADGVEVDELNLADLASVRSFAARLHRSLSTVDILVAGAAVMACPLARVGSGWEAQFATNHLGHYALTVELWPLLVAAGTARVVVVASGRDPESRIRWDDVHFEAGYDKWAAYAQSKLANVLFARGLDEVGRAHGVRAFSVNPGWIRTPLQRHLTTDEMVAAGWLDAAGDPLPGLFRSADRGAATVVWAATAPGLDAHGGDYCMDCQPTAAYPTDGPEAARLWALSADLTGLDLPT